MKDRKKSSPKKYLTWTGPEDQQPIQSIHVIESNIPEKESNVNNNNDYLKSLVCIIIIYLFIPR